MYQVMERNEDVTMLQSACLFWDSSEHTGSKVVSPLSYSRITHSAKPASALPRDSTKSELLKFDNAFMK